VRPIALIPSGVGAFFATTINILEKIKKSLDFPSKMVYSLSKLNLIWRVKIMKKIHYKANLTERYVSICGRI